MSRTNSTLRACLAGSLALAALAVASAYNPPAGAAFWPLLGSPQALGSGPGVTALDAPWADRLNPAASAAQQRPVLDLGYSLVLGLKDAAGAAVAPGHGLGLGASLPMPYGVWGAGLRLVSLPAGQAQLPLGTAVEVRGSIAKDLWPELFVGAGLGLSLGANPDFGLGAGLDLGLLHKPGDLGPLLDFRWGAVLSGIGRGFLATTPDKGNLSSGAGSSYPPSFTLSAGARALLIRTGDWKLGAGIDLSLPSFQDLGLNLSWNLAYKDRINLTTGWGLYLRELLVADSVKKSLIPSIGLSASFPVEAPKGDSFLAREGWNRSELKPALSAAPLYGSAWALSLGATLPLGVQDRNPPRIAATFPASRFGPFYLSPNADGKADLLELPVSITDERYLQSYRLTVRAKAPLASGGPSGGTSGGTSGAAAPSTAAPGAAGGEALGPILRSIANKESRPETQGFQGLWQRLTYVKKGVPVPPSLTWNGVGDSGEVLADGEYELYLEAADDNGNRGLAGPYPVVIDRTPPEAKIETPAEGLVFSPDGDGNRDSLAFAISGSREDLWTLAVLDASGLVLRKVEQRDAVPASFVWDGRTEDGRIVPDGVYALRLESLDRAGNPGSARVENIVVNTQQPPINLAIDLSAFSPNGDGIRDRLALVPSVPIRTGLLSWKLAVKDLRGAELWSLSGRDSASLRERFEFEGRGPDGRPLPEGQYRAELRVSYVNGHSPVSQSPIFLIDFTPPSGKVEADRAAFNPAGKAGQDRVRIAQSGSREEQWTGELVGPSGRVLRSWRFGAQPPATLDWDGTDESGATLPDGVYSYRLRAQDRAGNAFASAPVSFSLDTEKKAAKVAVDLRAFSPNGDGTKDLLRISTQVEARDRVASWELSVLPETEGARPARSWRGEGAVPESLTWGGEGEGGARAPEGRYYVRLVVGYLNADRVEDRSPLVVLDTLAPRAVASGEPLLFSPNGDGRLDFLRITQESTPGDDWEGRILSAAGQPVRSFEWKGRLEPFSWDGRDEAGNLVPDGAYRYELSSADAAGNRFSTLLGGIRVDARLPQVFVTAGARAISPNGDGLFDDLAFSLIVNQREGVSSWKFALVDAAGAEGASFSGEGGAVPARIVWDGKDARGEVREGDYVGHLVVDYEKGDRAEAKTAAVKVDVTPPAVEIRLSPEFFSPDNDGVGDELAIDLSVRDASPLGEWRFEIDEAAVEERAGTPRRERLFAFWTGTGEPARRLVWDGRSTKGELVEAATDYPFWFEVADALGNRTRVAGSIAVDVLVIREAERLKIKVPSIVFRPNFADFQGLAPDQLERNAKVVKRIAEILNRFRDYRIRIEGHGNSVAKIAGSPQAAVDKEETQELLPLSTARAELVQRLLAENGVDPRRLSVLGRGSAEPVVPFSDAENRWKNRRVEFILVRN